VKEREINVYKLEVERLRRWKKIEMDREQLSVGGGGGDSFLESAGKRSYNNKDLSVSRGSPGGFERGMFIKPEDFQIQNTPTDEYLSPFSIANFVSERPQSRSSISNYRSSHSP
jgi:hypothetical protein